MTDTSPTVEPPASAGRLDEYRLLPDATRVAFSTRHLFGLGAVSGTIGLLSGRMCVHAASERLVSLEAELDMTSFRSGSRSRDRAVTSARLLDVATHPIASYRAETAERTGAGWRVTGTLTIKGIAAPVELAVADLDPSTAVEAHATSSIDRFAYGISFPAALADRTLEIVIDTRGERVDA